MKQVFESDIELEFIRNWDKIEQFSGIIKPERQVKTPMGDKIDILAWEELDQRDVIIEIKRGNGRAERQLLRYRRHYPDALMFSITEKSVPLQKRLDFIEYYTIEEIQKNYSERL